MIRATTRPLRRRAPAKINLTLDVLGTRPDGYHEIASVMQTISLSDFVSIEPGPEGSGISLMVDGPEADGVPTDNRNIAWRAAEAFGARDVAIHIEKNIPAQAGLGGGSSDAATVLSTLNTLAGGKLSRQRLDEIGASIGADIPFFHHGGIAIVQGIGEKVTELPPWARYSLVIVKPPVGVLTAEAYRLLDKIPGRKSAGATARWPEGGLSNDFEQAIYPRFPEVAAARDALLSAGAERALLCGSGSTVFGITNVPEQVAERVEAAGVGRVYIAQMLRAGEQEI